MRIGALAERTGVSRRLLRYYEEQGLITPSRTLNGYREYAEAHVYVVLQITGLLDAGLPTDPGTPASQMFRVEGGKNRYIHEVTVCTTPSCGRGK